ncbi:MAG TPA: hypothetical protein VKR58_02940 [Aquella sp.]|nr:hypothetical protein [Aquella sp.]
MTELTLKLIIILIPGALGAIIINRLTIHKDWSPFIYTLNAIIIGLFGYLMLQLTLSLITFLRNLCSCTCHYEYKSLEIWNTISDSKVIPYKEVLGASFFGIILGFLGAYLDYNGIINKLGKKLKISNKYGDENLFSHFLNDKETENVYIRSIKDNLTYRGSINSYSENDSVSEIVLDTVSVYNYTDSELLYEIDKIYLSFS